MGKGRRKGEVRGRGKKDRGNREGVGGKRIEDRGDREGEDGKEGRGGRR